MGFKRPLVQIQSLGPKSTENITFSVLFAFIWNICFQLKLRKTIKNCLMVHAVVYKFILANALCMWYNQSTKGLMDAAVEPIMTMY